MVVVDPDQRPFGDFLGDSVGEELVDSLVGAPGAFFVYHPGLVVEDWPKNGVWFSFD